MNSPDLQLHTFYYLTPNEIDFVSNRKTPYFIRNMKIQKIYENILKYSGQYFKDLRITMFPEGI